MKVQVNVLVNLEIDPANYLEEDEVLVGSPEYDNDEEGKDALTEEMVVDRFRDQIDDGSLPMDDLLEQAIDYTITAKIATDGSQLWTELLQPSEVVFMNSFIEQIPEGHGVRDTFVSILQKLAVAQ